ncbi:MAG: XdhC family protein [Halanaerobiales bacterium]|nr:XdhC family protein [Halanaerobiales bacterium]
MNINFYKKLNSLTEKTKEVALVTVIDADDKYQELKEKKIALSGQEEIYSDEKSKDKLINVIESFGRDKILKMSNPELKEVELDDGTNLQIYIEPLTDNPRLVLFGAGHIANQVSKIASLMDFEITIVDDREDFLNRDRFPEADHIIVKKYTDFLKDFEVEKNDYIVIITRGHQFDYNVLREVIDTKAKYVGMIGSSKKNKEVFDKLREVDKVTEKQLDTVYTPIGLAIGAETTSEIAVAILGEIVKVRRLQDE